MSNFITCLYGTVLEINYLFHAGSARNYLFQKYCAPPPLRLNGGPLRGDNPANTKYLYKIYTMLDNVSDVGPTLYANVMQRFSGNTALINLGSSILFAG